MNHSSTQQPAPTRLSPVIWLVLGDKHGDNAQVEIVEQALPWTCIRKHVQVKDAFLVKKPVVKPSVDHIDLEHSDPLQPPWPDIILSVGRRPSMVALWIKQQSAGHSRIVLFGKPSSHVSDYDLTITSSEILMPPVSNVLTINYPLMRVDNTAIDLASKTWLPKLSSLPRPLIAIMIGGPTKPYVYDQRTTQRIISKAQQIINQQNGTVYLVTSRRTPGHFVDLLYEQLPKGAVLYRWNHRLEENPYKALLGLGDGFVVTEDSISMMIEIAKLGKPLAIFPLHTGRFGRLDRYRRALTGKLFASSSATLPDQFRILVAKCLYQTGLVRQVRDYRAFQNRLIEQGHAVPVHIPLRTPDMPLQDDLSLVVDAIVRFVDAPNTSR